MKIKNCRVCGNNFFKTPLISYKNMPAVAQHLPDADMLTHDKGVDLEVCQCSNCGLVQLSNEPVPYFREVIRASAFSPGMKEFRERQFRDFVEKYALRGKKVVEIGCGKGEYLSLMHACGANTYGLEYSQESVSFCRDSKLKVAKGFIETEDYSLDGAPFDAFFILNYLEHLPNLNTVLAGIRHNLADSGVGLVEVPNFDMILKKKLFTEFTTDHLFYFTKDTLAKTLMLNGFDVIECSEIWNDYIISAVVRKEPRLSFRRKHLFPRSWCHREEPEGRRDDLMKSTGSGDCFVAFAPHNDKNRLDLSPFHEHCLHLKNQLHSFVAQFANKKIAVWGAGHQAFASISLFGLADKIKYVVDSAPFKQGKYTPATHVPIVAPSTLKSDPVDAIIVMAGGYSDEVVKIIQCRHSDKINISVMRESGLEVRGDRNVSSSIKNIM